MKFQRTKVATALACALSVGSVALLTATYAQAQQADIKVDVTGTNIKRVEGENSIPVEIMTREDIKKTGATSVNELLRFIPSIDIYDQGEIASNSPSGSGTATIRMRGLSETNTLVLLNGRRLPVNALYDASGAGAAVDTNMIPISAIERVEVLKDGGSAIYGADAVAGVVNFITRKDFNGIDVDAHYGIAERGDAQEWGVNLTGGFGNYDKDGFNVLATLDVFKRDPIYRKDRDISKSVDFRRFGGADGRSGFAPQGNYVDPETGAYTGGSVQPCPPANLSGIVCRYDFNQSLLTSYNGADRWAGMVVGSLRVTKDIRATAQVIYAEAKDSFDAHPVPDYFVVPSGTGLIAGRFMQGGPRHTDRDSKLFDATIGLDGTTKWFDWDVAYNHGESKVENRDSNYYDANLWYEATGNGSIDPTVNTNDPALVQSLKVNPVREGKSTIDQVDARIRGDAFQLPGGSMGWAAGTSWWKEKLDDTPDPLTQAGEVVGSIQQSAVSADRDAWAVYGEVNAPVLKGLEINAALRYDHYDGANKTSPKIGVYWTPIKELAFRASYTESFRMPSLKQLYGAQEQGAGDLTTAAQCAGIGLDPSLCTESGVPFFQVNGSNTGLKPEKGKTYNVGVVTDLGPFSGSIDWWRIKIDDQITTPTIQTAIDQGLFNRDSTGRLFVYTNLQNSAEGETEGIDFDGRLRFPNTVIGTVTLRNGMTYYIKQRTREVGGEWGEFNGSYALPRVRNVFMASTEYGPWNFNVSNRYVGGFNDTADPWTASEPTPPTVRKVGSNTQWDIGAQYNGFKGWRLGGGIKNVLDQMPPLSILNGTNNQYEQVGFAPLYNARGRFYFVDVGYSFR